MIRMILIGILALPFFHIDDNIRFGYLLGAILLIIVMNALIILVKHINALWLINKSEDLLLMNILILKRI